MIPTTIHGWITLGIWTGLVAWSALLVGRKNPTVADDAAALAAKAQAATAAGVEKLKS